MNLNSYELALYIGCLEEYRNVSQVAELFYSENPDSARVSISRANAIESLMEKGMLKPKKKDTYWAYKSDSKKLREVLDSLDVPEKVIDAKVDETGWVERVAEMDKPKFQYFDSFLRNALIKDYLMQNRGLEKQDIELVNAL